MTLPDSTEKFWETWPERVRVHIQCPAHRFFWPDHKAVIKSVYDRQSKLRADPILARMYLDLCEEVGVPLGQHRALAREVFGDRLHIVDTLFRVRHGVSQFSPKP